MKQTKPATSLLIFLLLLFSTGLTAIESKSAFVLSLNGLWEMGSGRNYEREVTVPGIHTDAEKNERFFAPLREKIKYYE